MRGKPRLYVLPLQANRWYVGSSTNVERRVAAHRAGRGAAFTQVFKPTGAPAVVRDLSGPAPVGLQEDQLCLEYMCVYGVDRVRGGSHCAVTLPEAQRAVLERIVRHAHGLCLACGMPDHFTTDCHKHKRRRRAVAPPLAASPPPLLASPPTPPPPPLPASPPTPPPPVEPVLPACAGDRAGMTLAQLADAGQYDFLRFLAGYTGKRSKTSWQPEEHAMLADALQPFQQQARALMQPLCLCCFEQHEGGARSWSRWCPRCYAQLKRLG